VSKRQEKSAEKMQQPGWQDQIEPARESQPPPASYKRKTYLITPAMITRVKATAKEHRVGQNELVRFLLGYALDQLNAGNLELPLETTYRIKSDLS